MAEQPSSATTPTQPKRRFNLMLMMTLVALVGIALHYFLSRYYEQEQVPSTGNAELAQFELDAQVKSLQPVMDAMEAYYRTHEDWPQELPQLNLEPEMTESFTSLQLSEDGKLVFQGSGAMGPHQDKPLFLEPVGTPGTPEFTWQCTGIDIPAEFLPPYCRG